MPNEGNSKADRELVFSRLLNAPVELVWKAWTTPEHLKLWWGPDGFTNTIKEMNIKPGGKWELIMHSPNGTDYDIQCVFREIVENKKIVYEQLNHFKYIATIEFEKRKNKTLIGWRMLFESKEHLVEAAKAYGVIEGFKQNTVRLVDYLSSQTKHLQV